MTAAQRPSYGIKATGALNISPYLQKVACVFGHCLVETMNLVNVFACDRIILVICLVNLVLLDMIQRGGVVAENGLISRDNEISHIGDDCQVTPVIHVLQYPGCVPKPIPSFACVGRCSSYLQVSGSKIWQMERSCMCCQESGEREAAVSLFCPKAKQGERKFKKVLTKAPLDCMCRPCTSIEESGIVPQELAGYSDEGPLNNHFRRIALQ